MIAPATKTGEPLRHALGWHHPDLSDFEFRLVIPGPAIVLKNRQQVITIGGRPSITYSSTARQYLEHAAEKLAAQWLPLFREPIPAHVPLNVTIVTYLPTRRKPDASNLYEAPQDALKACSRYCRPTCRKHAGVITDDVQIESHDGSRRLYDKTNPRVELVLTPFRGATMEGE